jgi:hypothetical protein
MFKNLFRRSTVSETADSLPNPEPLLLAMNTVAQRDTPDNRTKLYREFLNSWLLLCVPELPQDSKVGMSVLASGMNISVATRVNANGDKVLPVFTDQAALANYDPNSPYLAFPAVEAFKIALRIGTVEVVVNSFDPVRKPIRVGGTLMLRELEALAQGMIPKPMLNGRGQVLVIPKGTELQIGPCQVPIRAEVKSRVEATAVTLPEVARIFRYGMKYVETGTESEVFAVECSAADSRVDEIMTSLMSCIQPLLASGQHVDFTKFPANMTQVQSRLELVYERRVPDGHDG